MPIMQAPPNKLNPLADTMFNKQWVSVPHGSEVNFVVNSKNSYEEALFKVCGCGVYLCEKKYSKYILRNSLSFL